MNEERLLNDEWYFAKTVLDTEQPEDNAYQPVDLPHDWLIEDSTNLYENSIGWYKRRLDLDDLDKLYFLYFDGVYMDSQIFVNGIFVGEWKYGYSAFEFEITEALKMGSNEILVKVVHQAPNSRWYSGAGIYRNVSLKIREQSYIPTDGVYVSITENSHDEWHVQIETEAIIQGEATMTQQLFDGDELILSKTESTQSFHTTQKLIVHHPERWSLQHPFLYRLVTLLMIDGKVVDQVENRIGFRTVKLDPNYGFLLNGEKIKLNGVCEHHDLGALGAAFNPIALRRRLHILKDMGVNGIRTAHNMPAKELMHFADEMGFVVISEAFDMWERPKTTYDYARFFKEWYKKDVRSWVRRDRNHPSLILWSIGNEIYDTHVDERGQEITRKLLAEVRKHDPYENAKVTIGSNYMPWENAQKCADIVKIAGYNYAEKYYHEHHEKYPDWVIYGSETASTVQSRGIYHFPYEQSVLSDDDQQCSSLGNSTTSWGAKSTEACITDDRDAPFSLGTFIWTGFDYIGEPTPYHTKNSYLGQIDTATFPKDSYYIYQSAWTDYKQKPMIHIFPYWDFNEGQIIDVRVASNAPKVELQCNGETIGTFDIDHEHGKQLVGWWKVPYKKGELKAIAYDEDGNIIATDVRRSFSDPASISLRPDKTRLQADGEDLIFIEISMKDKVGNPVENATNRVEVQVTGAGRLVGLDNGDSTDYDSFKGTSRRLFSGKLMAIIAAKLEPGDIHVEVSSEGLPTEIITLQAVQPSQEIIGRSALLENQPKPIIMGQQHEIPARRIDLRSLSGRTFTKEQTEIEVVAEILPANASYQEVEWRVVTDAGIDTNIATIESNGKRAIIRALGDGDFRVRCTSKNGTDHVRLISELEFTAEGLGKAFKNPYEFISAGLYDDSEGEVSNGNERGIASSRDGMTKVGFHDIDFGNYGSNTITLPIFALTSNPYEIEIWEGKPQAEGSSLLASVIYQKESRWNVYQAETYTLAKRLKGITSIWFVFNDKVHLKGFKFATPNRTWSRNEVTEADQIYGDSYHPTEDAIRNIGNNVTISFDAFDFGKEGATQLVIAGHSPIDKNTIHVQFSGEQGKERRAIEFLQSDDFVIRTFHIEKITGKQKVEFIFLPGSKFDFQWFCFKK